MLKLTIHRNGFGAVEERLANAAQKAEYAVAVQIRKDTEPFVPALTGSLSNRTYILNDLSSGISIVYPGPYARYLYHGKLMVDPETGKAWAGKGSTKMLTDKNLVFNRSMHGQAQDHWFEASAAQNMKKWLNVAEKAVEKFV